jgi:NADH-quinone oxidoreductase subunit N
MFVQGIEYSYSCVLPLLLVTLLLGLGAFTYALDFKVSVSNGSAWVTGYLGGIVALMAMWISTCLDGTGLSYSQLALKGSVLVDGRIGILGFWVFTRLLSFIFISRGYRNRTRSTSAFEFDVLLLFSAAGTFGLRISDSLLRVYLFLELSTLCGLILVGINVSSPRSTEAALKYFIMSARTTGVFLLGTVLIYFDTGSLLVSDLNTSMRLTDGGVGSIGIFLVAISFLVKLGVAPFHHWAPDVYDGAPLNSTAFLNLVPKLGRALFVFSLVQSNNGPLPISIIVWIQFFGVASLLFGTFGALYQVRIKRFLAYSSVSHIGYIIITRACYSSTAFEGVVLYLLVYLITSLRVWASLLAADVGSIRPVDKLSDLGGLATTNPGLYTSLMVGFFSMAARPPFAGFLAKFVVLSAPIEDGLMMSVISTFFYLRIVITISFGNTDGGIPVVVRDRSSAYVISSLIILLSLWMLSPSSMLDLIAWYVRIA